jgi:hypothetical protein
MQIMCWLLTRYFLWPSAAYPGASGKNPSGLPCMSYTGMRACVWPAEGDGLAEAGAGATRAFVGALTDAEAEVGREAVAGAEASGAGNGGRPVSAALCEVASR